jgi:membrane-bound inhibitor of C-type lysozyme
MRAAVMNDLRQKVAAALLSGVLSVFGGAQAHAAPSTTVRYQCGARQSLVIERDKGVARVRFVDRTYELKRRASSIGVKYLSPTAALIIDGTSAVFVADDRLQLGACTQVPSIASAR